MGMIHCIPGWNPYKKGGDACREISIEPLKGANLGVALSSVFPRKCTSQKNRHKQLVLMNLIAIKIKALNTFPYQSFGKHFHKSSLIRRHLFKKNKFSFSSQNGTIE